MNYPCGHPLYMHARDGKHYCGKYPEGLIDERISIMETEQAHLLLTGSQYHAEPSKSTRGRFNIRHRNSGAIVYALLTPGELLRRARQISPREPHEHTTTKVQ